MKQPHKTGAALVEILLAMMIMSIGLFMVISIFPIAIKRSVQSSQLTNGRLVKEQAEQLLQIVPGLKPDHSTFLATNIQGKETKVAVPGEIRLRVLDPISYWHMQGQEKADVNRIFGNDNGNPDARGVIRINGGTTGITWDTTQEIMLNKDTWNSQRDDLPLSNTLTSITFSDESSSLLSDLSANILNTGTATAAYPFKTLGRVELFYKDFKESQVRVFTAANINVPGRQINLGTALPAKYNTAVTKALIQVLDQRYSWMLTTRQKFIDTGTTAAVGTSDDNWEFVTGSSYIVIFFRRPVTSLPEQIHTASGMVTNQKQLTINWGGEKPNIKPGAYFMDLENGAWYRIASVESNTDKLAKVTLNRGVVETFSNLVLPEGVVEVYPITLTR